MNIVQINSVLNSGSTGRIAEQIGQAAIQRGHTSYIAYGRSSQSSESTAYKIGGYSDFILHGAESALADRQGLGSRGATKNLVEWIEKQKPDAIGLHNIHGYYLNYPTMFKYLRRSEIPVIWTLHDCWAFTGHCAHFGRFDCSKWKEQCFECPMTAYYPRSMTDYSRRNFDLKKRLFCGLKNLSIVTPSRWLRQDVARSFLAEYPVRVIHNGIDIDVFTPSDSDDDELIILGVANAWTDRKGLGDFTAIRNLLPPSFRIVLVGVTQSQKSALPEGIEGVEKTENLEELVNWYQRASVFVNPTYSDNFPTTNIEALACGTPVVTYDTGGSPESLSQQTGRVVEPGDIQGLNRSIEELVAGNSREVSKACRARVENLFNQSDRFAEYIDLYETL